MDWPTWYHHSRFNAFDGELTLVAAKGRHWRDKVSLSCTFAALRGTIRELARARLPLATKGTCGGSAPLVVPWEEGGLGMIPNPLDDYANSLRLNTLGASVVSPLPGLATQMENVDCFVETEVGLYHDWLSHAQEALAAAEKTARAGQVPWPLPLLRQRS